MFQTMQEIRGDIAPDAVICGSVARLHRKHLGKVPDSVHHV